MICWVVGCSFFEKKYADVCLIVHKSVCFSCRCDVQKTKRIGKWGKGSLLKKGEKKKKKRTAQDIVVKLKLSHASEFFFICSNSKRTLVLLFLM